MLYVLISDIDSVHLSCRKYGFQTQKAVLAAFICLWSIDVTNQVKVMSCEKCRVKENMVSVFGNPVEYVRKSIRRRGSSA